MKKNKHKMMISMKRYIILIFAGLLLLPGCNLYKKYDSKANTVQGNLMGDVMNPQDTLSIGDMSWRDVFKDPLLQQLIDKALVNNTDMRTAQLTIEQAQNEVRSAKWGYAPTLSFSPNASYNYQGGAGSYNVQIPVRASWQLGIFGQNRSKVRSAKAKLAYDEDYRQAVQVDLAANVANLYYTLVMLDRQLAISEATEILYQESYNTTQALFQAGTYNSPAVYEMQASLEALRTDIVTLRYSIVATEASLCQLLAEPPHHIDRSSFEQFEMPEQIHVGLPVRLSLDGLFGLGGTFNALSLIGQAVGSLTQPILQGGQLKAQLRNAKAEQEKARLEFVQTLYDAGSEVYQYKKAIETAEEKTGHIDIRVNALQEAFSATTELMNHGSTTYLEVLTAQESLLSAQLAQVENRYEMVQALINLYTALGGFGK